MKFELKKVEELPECFRKKREQDAAASFCREEDYPGVDFTLTKWPTCLGETEIAIYRPKENRGALPVFLYIHGGGWCTKSLKFLDDVCRQIVQNTGICVVSPEYHLAPENPFPGLLYECYDVAQYIKANAEELNFNPEKIAVGGDSAGGNISAALCLMMVKENRNLFKAHILYYPALDLTRGSRPDPNPADAGISDEEESRYMVDAYTDGFDRTDPLISPLFMADEFAARMPRLMMVTSDLDGLCAEGEEYAIKLQRNGVEVLMRRQINGTHGTLNRKNCGYEETMELTYRYLRAVLL